MTEPKTIADAQRLTLAKIEECMKRPRDERSDFWQEIRWSRYSSGYDARKYCAFCIVADLYTEKGAQCRCIAIEACGFFRDEININEPFWGGEERQLLSWHKKNLRKLYRMVKEIEV